MWVMTFHSACARILRREAERLGYKRSFTIYDQADSQRMVKRCMDELDVDPKRFPPRAVQSQISGREEPPARRRGLPRGAGRLLRADRRRRLRAVRAPDARGERDGLRRPPRAHREPLRALRGRPPPLPEGLPLDPRGRVPGHQPRPVPAAPAALRGARQPDGRRRRRAVGLLVPPRRHPQHPRLRARLPGRRGREARAELPLHRGDPRGGERGDRQQPRAEAEGAVDGPRARGDGEDRRARRRARGGALRRGRDRAG